MEHMDLGIGFVEMGEKAEESMEQLRERFPEVPILSEKDVVNDGNMFYVFVGEHAQSSIMEEVLRDKHGCDLTKVKLKAMKSKMMESFINLLLPGVVNLDVGDLAAFFEKSKRPKDVLFYEFSEDKETPFLPENIIVPITAHAERLLVGFRGVWSLWEVDAVLKKMLAAAKGTDNILVSFGYEDGPRKMIVIIN